VGGDNEDWGRQHIDPDALLGRPRPGRPLEPPKDSHGSIDYNAWEKILRGKGVRGLPDSELDRKIRDARSGDRDAQAELSLAERYADAGYEVEVVRPYSEGGPIVEPYSPDLRVKIAGQQTLRVDVKFRESGNTISRSSLNAQVDHANIQIKESREGHGDIVVDCSEAQDGGMDQGDFERYLRGKVSGSRIDDPSARLRNIDYLEIIYPDNGLLKRSFMIRLFISGAVDGPFTEALK
jgi:hypothetical protein